MSTVRWMVAMWLVVACGRVGFDATISDGGPGDGRGDASDDAGSCERSCTPAPVQSGCCAGDACQLVDFEPLCVLPGIRRVGDPCSDADRCAAGLTCEAPYTTDPRGTCVSLCDVNSDCPATTWCAAIGDDVGAIVPEAGGCSSTCNDPRGGTGCGTDRTCRLIRLADRTSTLRYAVICDILGTAGMGATCSGSLDCSAGHQCNNGICRQVCRIGQADCTIGTCTGVNPPAVVGGVTYGLCV